MSETRERWKKFLPFPPEKRNGVREREEFNSTSESVARERPSMRERERDENDGNGRGVEMSRWEEIGWCGKIFN